MIAPPVIDQSPQTVSGRRDYLGWFLLAFLFLFVLVNAVAAQKASDKQGRFDQAEGLLQDLVKEKGQKSPLFAATDTTSLSDIEKALGPYRLKDPTAAAIDSAAKVYLGKPVDPVQIRILQTSKSPLDRNAAVIFNSSKLQPGDLPRLTAGLENRGFTAKLVAAEAYGKAGNPRPLQNLAQSSLARLGLIGGVIGVLAMLSFAAWIFVLGEKASGRLRPLGFKVSLPSLFDADRLAMLAALLLFVFLLIGTVVSLGVPAVIRNPPAGLDNLLTALAMLVCVPLLFRATVLGKRVSLDDLGVEPKGLLSNVGIGLLGFLLELPVAMLLALVGTLIFSGLHPTHPATQELLTNHSPLLVGSLFFFAVIVAPFWEEIMFRGLLFPALSRVTGKVVTGAIISSFLFGAVHPQGLPLLMALMAVAGMSCTLTYHTRSLVPSIVMHGAHNAVLLTLSLLYS